MKSREELLRDFKNKILDQFESEDSIDLQEFINLQTIIYNIYKETVKSEDVTTNYVQNAFLVGYNEGVKILTQKLHSALSNRGCADIHDILNEEADALTIAKHVELYDELQVREEIFYDN